MYYKVFKNTKKILYCILIGILVLLSTGNDVLAVNYDNDGMSGSFYLIAGAILLVITLLVYLFNPSMFK